MSINLRMKYIQNSECRPKRSKRSQKHSSIERNSSDAYKAKENEPLDEFAFIKAASKNNERLYTKDMLLTENELLHKKILDMKKENFSLVQINASLLSQIESMRTRSTSRYEPMYDINYKT